VLKRGRKGRISNELVAASCAAIVAVYAAGSWRTRDADRRFGAEGEMRRPVRPTQATASVPAAVATAVSRAISPAAPATPPAAIEPGPVSKKSVKVEPLPSPPPAPSPAVLAQSTGPAIAAAATAIVEPKPELAPEAAVAAADETGPAAPAHPHWFDGYYTGWGQSRHGDIQAFVRIEDGKIADVGIATCDTRYPCSVIDRILLQPLDLQGPDVDRVSRATESGDAYYYALVMALGNAETGTYRSKRP
jgi:uncharacterized protein with FMN-binding domain